MSIAKRLRKIQADINTALADDPLDTDAMALAARRIGMQAEMVELGISDD